MDSRLIQWFGEPWGAPVCDPEQRIDVPEGERCARCLMGFSGGFPSDPTCGQGLAVPYVDPIDREETRGMGNAAERYEHLYFHRTCFMRAIRADP